MKKKEEFQKLIESLSDRDMQSEDSTENFYIGEIIHIFKNLNDQIDEQRENNNRLLKQIEGLNNSLKLLTKELVKSGYLKIGEKRNFLTRNIYTLEALINLLNKKLIINKKELLYELKKKREADQMQKDDF
jgi:hypothetical protein